MLLEGCVLGMGMAWAIFWRSDHFAQRACACLAGLLSCLARRHDHGTRMPPARTALHSCHKANLLRATELAPWLLWCMPLPLPDKPPGPAVKRIQTGLQLFPVADCIPLVTGHCL